MGQRPVFFFNKIDSSLAQLTGKGKDEIRINRLRDEKGAIIAQPRYTNNQEWLQELYCN